MAAITPSRYTRTANFDVLDIGEPITVVNITPSHTANVTKYPLESGSFVSDHLQVQPTTISVRGMVGNLVLDPSYKAEKGAPAWEKLVNLFESAEPINLIEMDISKTFYTDMVITSLSAPRNATVGTSVVFEMELQQVKFVDTVSQTFNPPPDTGGGGGDDPGTPTGDRPSDDEHRGEVGAVDDPQPPPVKTGGGGGGGLGDHLRRYRDDDDVDTDFELDGPDGTPSDERPSDEGSRGEDFFFSGRSGVERIRAGVGIQVQPNRGIGEVTISTLPDDYQIPDGGQQGEFLSVGENSNELVWSDIRETEVSFELSEKYLVLEAQTSSTTDPDPAGVWEIRTDQGADSLDFMRYIDDLHTSYLSLNHFTEQAIFHKPTRFEDATWIHGGIYFDHEPNPLPNPASGQSLLFGNPVGDPIWQPHGGTARNLMPSVPTTDGRILTSQGGQPSWQPATNPDTAYPITLNDSFEISLDFTDTDFQVVDNALHLLDARRVPSAGSGDENKILTVDNGLPTWQDQLTGSRNIRISSSNEIWVRYNNLHFTSTQDNGLELSFLQAIPLLTRDTRSKYLSNTGTALTWIDAPVYTAGDGMTVNGNQFGVLVNQQDLLIGGSGVELQPNRRIPNFPTDAVRHQLEFNGTGLEWVDNLVESVTAPLSIAAKDLRLSLSITDFDTSSGSLALQDDKRLPELPSDSVPYVLTSTNASLAWGSPAVTNPIEVDAGVIGFNYSSDDFAVSADGLELQAGRRLPDTPPYTVPRYLVHNQRGLEWVSNLYPEVNPPIRIGNNGRVELNYESTDFIVTGQRLQLHPHRDLPTPPEDNQTKVLITNNRSYSWGSQATEAPIAVSDSNEIKLKYSLTDFIVDQHGYFILQETQRLPALPPSDQRPVWLKATSSQFEWGPLPPPAVGGALSISSGNVILNYEPTEFLVSGGRLQLHPFRDIPNPPSSSTPHYLRAVSQNYSWVGLPPPTASAPVTVSDDGDIELLLDQSDLIVFNNRLTLNPSRKYPDPPSSTTPHYLSVTSTNGFQWLTKPVSDVDLPLDVNNNRIQLRYVSTDFALENDRLSLHSSKRLPNAPTPYSSDVFLQYGRNGMEWVSKPAPDVTTPLTIGDDGVELNINTLEFQIANGQLELNPNQRFPAFPIGSDTHILQVAGSSLSWQRHYASLPELPAGTDTHALRSINQVLSWTQHYADLPELPSTAGAKFLQVDGSTLTWETIPAQIPSYDDQIPQFILSVNNDGSLYWRREEGQLLYFQGEGIYIDPHNNQISVTRPVPTGGTVGQALRVGSDGSALEWADVSTQMISYLAGDGLSLTGTTFSVTNPFPSGGTDGQFLKRTATGHTWESIDIPDVTSYRAGAGISILGDTILMTWPIVDSGEPGQILTWGTRGQSFWGGPLRAGTGLGLNGYYEYYVQRPVPSGGNEGEVLRIGAGNGLEWASISGSSSGGSNSYTAGTGISISSSNQISVTNPLPAAGRNGQSLQIDHNGNIIWRDPYTIVVDDPLYLVHNLRIGLRRAIPAGGETGQLLAKSADGYEWTTPSQGVAYGAGEGLSLNNSIFSVDRPLPGGGTDGQILSRTSSGYGWIDPSSGGTTYSAGTGLTLNNDTFNVDLPVPSGGSENQVLTRLSSGIGWTTIQTGATYTAGLGISLTGTEFNVDRPVPTGGTAGQLLGLNSSGLTWITPAVGVTYQAGVGLTLSDDGIFNVQTPLPVGGSDGEFVGVSGGSIVWTTPPNDNTEYIAGAGLSLTGTVFSVDRIIPSGGVAGQLLARTADGYTWSTPSQGTVYSAGTGLSLTGAEFSVELPLPALGTDGQILSIDSGSLVWVNPTDEDTEYTAGTGLSLSQSNEFTVTRPIPSGGSVGQFLRRTSSGYEWAVPIDTNDNTEYSAGSGLTLTGTTFSVTNPFPSGGTNGQLLSRTGSGYAWINPAEGVVYSAGLGLSLTGAEFAVDQPVPTGGSAGQVLSRQGTTGLSWIDQPSYSAGSGLLLSSTNVFSLEREIPAGGAEGQIIGIVSGALAWTEKTVNTDTTYSAGAGLSLSGSNVFALDIPIPSGGTNGQVLQLTSGVPAWQDLPDDQDTTYSVTGSGLSLNASNQFSIDQPVPSGGADGQFLMRSGTSSLAWRTPSDTLYSAGTGLTLTPSNQFNVDRPVPSGGATGEFMMRTQLGYGWGTPTDTDTTYSAGGSGLSLSDANAFSIDLPVPSGGTLNQILARRSSGIGWVNLRDLPGSTPSVSTLFDGQIYAGAAENVEVGNDGFTSETTPIVVPTSGKLRIIIFSTVVSGETECLCYHFYADNNSDQFGGCWIRARSNHVSTQAGRLGLRFWANADGELQMWNGSTETILSGSRIVVQHIDDGSFVWTPPADDE